MQIEFEGETVKVGNSELRIFGSEGIIYACPTMVFHYVKDHLYRPPQAFIDAVLNQPDPKGLEYQSRLSQLKLDA